MSLESTSQCYAGTFGATNFFERCVVPRLILASVLVWLLLVPFASASVIPIIVDDVHVFIPCADVVGNVGTAGATVTFAGRTALSDSAGKYSFTCVLPRMSTLQVSKLNHTFSPASVDVSVPAGAAGTIVRNFSLLSVCADVIGNAVAPGATVSAGTKLAVTDSSGNYRLACLPSGAIAQLSAARPGYIFSPSIAFVSIPSGSSEPVTQNFSAQTCGSIVGNVGVAGARVQAGSQQVVSDSTGAFKLTCLPAGTYTVQPSASEYAFTPVTASINIPANSNVTVTQNFVARANCASVTGSVGIAAGSTISAGGKTTTADSNGNYSLCLPLGSYSVTPVHATFQFLPASSPLTVASTSVSYTKSFTPLSPPTENAPPLKYVLGDVAIQVSDMRGGSSGFQRVIEVDLGMLAKRPAMPNDPYWYRYYRGFFDANGVHLSARFSQQNLYQFELATKPNMEVWNTITSSGLSSAHPDFINVATEFDSRVPHATFMSGSTPTVFTDTFLEHHFRMVIGDGENRWVPGWYPNLGPYYRKKGLAEANGSVFLNFKIELYKRLKYRPYSPNYAPGMDVWDRVFAGEVHKDGWGIVPMDSYVTDSLGKGQGVAWAIVVPKGRSIRVRNNSADCPVTGVINEVPVEGAIPCIIDPKPWIPLDAKVIVTNGVCTDTAGYIVTSLGDACRLLSNGTYADTDQIRRLAALVTMSYGGNLLQDDAGVLPEMAGMIWVVNPDGSMSRRTREEAAVIARAYGQIFMNGSMNSPSDAIANAARIAADKGLPVVLIYMAQRATTRDGKWTDYPLDDTGYQKAERETLRYLLAATAGAETTVIGHSWSGHIVLSETKAFKNVNAVLVNPAHRTGGATAERYFSDVETFGGKSLRILAGSTDWVSMLGGGQWFHSIDTPGVILNTRLKYALEEGIGRQQLVVGQRADSSGRSVRPVGHGMADMIGAGAGAYIPTRAPLPVW